jgi:hypothetical protein
MDHTNCLQVAIKTNSFIHEKLPRNAVRKEAVRRKGTVR